MDGGLGHSGPGDSTVADSGPGDCTLKTANQTVSRNASGERTRKEYGTVAHDLICLVHKDQVLLGQELNPVYMQVSTIPGQQDHIPCVCEFLIGQIRSLWLPPTELMTITSKVLWDPRKEALPGNLQCQAWTALVAACTWTSNGLRQRHVDKKLH